MSIGPPIGYSMWGFLHPPQHVSGNSVVTVLHVLVVRPDVFEYFFWPYVGELRLPISCPVQRSAVECFLLQEYSVLQRL